MRGPGLGGWSLSVHHTYDRAGRKLYLGNGDTRRAEARGGGTITTLAGSAHGFGGDNGPAEHALLANPLDVAVGLDGSIYIADNQNWRVRRVDPAGTITTVVGTGTWGFGGDGGPAAEAVIGGVQGISIGPDGSLYLSESGGYGERIRRVGSDGVITTIAGTGVRGFDGDGGPATQARFDIPSGLAVGQDGSLYIADQGNQRIRRVGPDGIITTVAGNGVYDFSGDGVPATQAAMRSPIDVDIGPDGSIYIAEGSSARIRRVTPDGIITTFAGVNPILPPGYTGDGGPATAAMFLGVHGVAASPDGSLYIATGHTHRRVRRVSPDGIATTFAGNGTFGDRGDGGPATLGAIVRPFRVAVGPDGTMYVADPSDQRIRKVQANLSGFDVADVSIMSKDAREIYVFDDTGRQIRTLEALTGAVQYTFEYASGLLETIKDASNNTTRIERLNGVPSAIIAPGGQRTALSLDPNGYLKTVANPASETTTLTHDSGGLLRALRTPRQQDYFFDYDPLGRLTTDDDPAGGMKTLVRTDAATSYTVSLSTLLNRVYGVLCRAIYQRRGPPDNTLSERALDHDRYCDRRHTHHDAAGREHRHANVRT